MMHMAEHASQAARRNELTEARARKLIDELLESTGMNPVSNLTVRAFCDDWLDSKRLSVSQSSFVRYTHALRLLVEGLGQRADKPLSALRPFDVAAYRDSRIKENVSGGTLSHDLRIVRSMLSLPGVRG